jgi:hypothetical protein
MENKEQLTTVQVAILKHLEAGKSQAEAAKAVTLELGIMVRPQEVSAMMQHNPHFKRKVLEIRQRLNSYGNISNLRKAEILRLMTAEDINQVECSKRLGINSSEISRLKAVYPDWAEKVDAVKAGWVTRRIAAEVKT